jgi:hypothetical protein
VFKDDAALKVGLNVKRALREPARLFRHDLHTYPEDCANAEVDGAAIVIGDQRVIELRHGIELWQKVELWRQMFAIDKLHASGQLQPRY